MKTIINLLIIIILSAYHSNNKNTSNIDFEIFDSDNHLIAMMDKSVYDSLHSWEFGWELLAPINKAESYEHEKELAKRFSPGQKALYFFWYLDAQVTNGGFIQFYWNDYRKYVPVILEGLKLIGDTALIDLIVKADKEYIENMEFFAKQIQEDDWETLYNNLTKFTEYDDLYYEINNKTMELIEIYARLHPDEFVEFN